MPKDIVCLTLNFMETRTVIRNIYRYSETIALQCFVLVLFTFCLISCSADPEEESIEPSKINYSFFVAGHVYGRPSYLYLQGEEYNGGIYPPFKDKFTFLRNYSGMQFGVFLGDIVKDATSSNWDKIDTDLTALNIPVHFAVGNHDMSDWELFDQRYGNTYFSYKHLNDVFIVLNPNISNWNISGKQYLFLETCLSENEAADHIFVFFHQLLWWDASNKYQWVEPNSTDGRADSINFWSDVEPLLKASCKNVYLFAGDVGAHPGGESYMFDQYENIHLIATGMGGGKRDNFVICHIHEDKSVSYKLIALNEEDDGALGKLEDYRLATGWSRFWRRVWGKLSQL